MNDESYYKVIEALQNAKKNIIQAEIADSALYDELNIIWARVNRIEKGYNKAFSEYLHKRIKGGKQ